MHEQGIQFDLQGTTASEQGAVFFVETVWSTPETRLSSAAREESEKCQMRTIWSPHLDALDTAWAKAWMSDTSKAADEL